ncbi:MAG: prolipoprotein diacylglyceryl transferase, partial [Pseudomonadales bacterium]
TGNITMWHYPELNPIAVSIGPVSVHWYAISYLVGILLVWGTVLLRVKRHQLDWTSEQFSDLLFFGVLGVILGGRFGYVFFYGLDNFLADPLSLFKIWQGGMSFHGGMIGVSLGVLLYGYWNRRNFFDITDIIAPSIPLALGCGRLGNFVNGELPGRVTDVSWAVIYPGDMVGRHPSSLYQATLEGLVLFALLWFYARKPRRRMAVTGAFLVGYGGLRIFSEFFREPDAHIGFIFAWVTTGQLLSLPMVALGAFLFALGYWQEKRQTQQH